MREIKFRAKTVLTDDWVYGHYAFVDGYHVIYENGKPLIIKLNTLGEYTGLKDAKGCEIYEKDIITTEYGNRKVYWHNKFACWSVTDFGDSLHLFHDEGEVIGNTYDNPKLLEEVNK